MAITVTSPNVSTFGFIKNCVSANASACEEIHPAVVGKQIRIRHITINSTDAITITIGQGATAGAVTTALIGPIAFAALSSLRWDFSPFLLMDENTSLTVDTSGAGNICIFVTGFVS